MTYIFKKINISFLRISVAFLVCAACAISCKTSRQPSKEKEAQENTLHLYLQAEPISLDPRVGGDRRSQMLLRELFEGLYRIDEKGNPAPALAQKMVISDDQLHYQFTLRESQWSSGEPVTAYDFEYAWKSILDPSFVSHYPYAFFVLKNGRKAKIGEVAPEYIGVKAIDSLTLEVELEHPAPYFLELIANPLYSPICAKRAKNNPDWHKSGGNLYICNGPFHLHSWTHQSEIALKKNSNYWDSTSVPLENITFAILENPQTALNMFDRGSLDWVGEPFGNLPLEAIPHLSNRKELQSYQIGGLFWFLFNTENPLLSSTKIRKALSYAINRQEITKHLLQGGETPAFTILPEQFTLIQAPLYKDNDIATAKILFDEGIKELGMTKDTMPALTLSHWKDQKEQAIAEAVQQEWQKTLGIRVQLASCDWASYLQKIRSADFQVLGANWWTWYKDPIYNLELLKYRDNGFNGTRWEHSRYIELLDQSDNECDPKKRRELLEQAEILVAEEMPLAPVYCHTYKFACKPYVKGWYLSPVGQMELKHVSIQD